MKAGADKSGWHAQPARLHGGQSCSLLEGRGAGPWEGLAPAFL